MENLAIIDIGSNSVKMVIAKIKTNKSFKIIDEKKEIVRLGDNMGEDFKLAPEKINKTVQTLKTFKNFCQNKNTENIITVATAAVRKATNQNYFLRKVKQEAKLDVTVLSGKKEGYFDYLAVVNSIDKKEGLIMDIGGGSTELIWMKNKKTKKIISLPFGGKLQVKIHVFFNFLYLLYF